MIDPQTFESWKSDRLLVISLNHYSTSSTWDDIAPKSTCVCPHFPLSSSCNESSPSIRIQLILSRICSCQTRKNHVTHSLATSTSAVSLFKNTRTQSPSVIFTFFSWLVNSIPPRPPPVLIRLRLEAYPLPWRLLVLPSYHLSVLLSGLTLL